MIACIFAEGHYPLYLQGLCLDLKNLRMAPKLLARLARYVSNKQEVRKVASQLLPDLCQVGCLYGPRISSVHLAADSISRLSGPVWKLSHPAQLLWHSETASVHLNAMLVHVHAEVSEGVLQQILPFNPRDLCISTSISLQGVSLDTLLQRIIQCKVEMRKAMLSGYMQALDESEGLQPTISRLADRMGVGEHPYLPICPPA